MTHPYYAVPGCEGLLQQLLHLLRFGEGLPVVQAAHGAGKSSMADELRTRLHDCSWLTLVRCEQDQELAELLEQLCLGFGLQTSRGAGESLAVLRQFSTQLVNNRELAALVLDDVNLLDNQTIGAVLSLLQGNNYPGYGLHLVFFGAPGLVERVDELALLDTPIYDFEIPHFSPSELSGFLKSRFPAAGSGLLNATVIQGIWGQSLGSPGIALTMFEKRLSENAGADKKLAMFRSMPKGHLIALGVLIAVLVWAIFARDAGDQEETPGEKLAIPGLREPATRTDTEGEIVREDTSTRPTITNPVDDQQVSRKNEEVQLLREQENTLQLEQDAIDIGKPATDTGSAPLSGNPAVTLQTAPTVSNEPDSPASKSQQKETVYQTPPAKIEGVEKKQTPPTPSGMTADELFLLDQPPETYTLQVIAASRKDALLSYISEQKNRDDLYLYQSLREGRAWFVVVTGIFTSREEAQQAVSGLPDKQKKAGPWPRQLSDVQREIATNRSR